ncbi:hypothetical protein FJ970_13940 [Mesorhizobium sp. B2-1-8]|uniref:hypothetical protein n=1 Tax=unclassified Mesorhizobium TaxID=325217 RepID=UPI00112A69B4|nr:MULTISPECIES: hypothetical protein [unclassified Mesorhizobium]MBZ9670830.1 hypothetical protein [Mesorhizobium sp. ES1-3]TPI32954.1 hypothetical protein FJW08_07185 [Mesorhizobium sp. B3-2-1]UCI21986.1 hypothetical protein FJ970_13940 [Mesorhizobium sp. B2-1-8]
MSTLHLSSEYRNKQDSLSEQSKSVHHGAMELQTAILLTLRGYRRRSVISTNYVMKRVRQLCPDCVLADHALAGLIQEAAVLLALIPVFDPCLGKDR